MNKRTTKAGFKELGGGPAATLVKDLAKTVSAIQHSVEEVAKTGSVIQHAVDEVAEDNVAIIQAIRRNGEGNEALRTLVVQEVAQLRTDIAGGLLAHALRNYCRDLSPVLNALEGILGRADFNDAATLRQHVESVALTLVSAMGRMGIERIPVAVGDCFNSHTHDCVRRCDATDSPIPEAASGTIVFVQEPGYAVLGKLALPPKVWVQKLEQRENQPEEQNV